MTVVNLPLPSATTHASPVPAGPTTMEKAGLESLRKGLIHTDISPATARWMTYLFMAGIVLVPVVQLAYELISPNHGVQEINLFRPTAKAAKEAAHGEFVAAFEQLRFQLNKEHLEKFEDDLKEGSVFRRAIQPRVQYVFSRYLGFGNAASIVARERFIKPNGWLYYQLGVDYLAGPGMLEPDFIRVRENKYYDDGETSVCADPRKAIIQFHRDCQAAGVHLVFVPIPVKPSLQPGELEGKPLKTPVPVVHNRDYDRFVADLRAAGVDVFDEFIPKVVEPDREPIFLRQDTHWTPQWMEMVAKQLADHVRKRVTLPAPAYPFEVIVEEADAARVGDIVDTLNLPKNQTLFPPQEIVINRVLDARTKEPRPWREDSDVLFIGDSFSNIFSWERMGWGTAAGFPFQVSRYLGRDLDALIENGKAASELRVKLAERPHPLKGKRIVIWEVAMHELTCSNWKVLPISSDPAASSAAKEPVAGR